MNISELEILTRKVWGLPKIVPWSAQDYLAHQSLEFYERVAGRKMKIEELEELLKL